jgi:hypothetical protein
MTTKRYESRKTPVLHDHTIREWMEGLKRMVHISEPMESSDQFQLKRIFIFFFI